MRKILSVHIKCTATILIVCLTVWFAKAQKLADIQENSVWAPGKVKVDGKPTEWNNSFQAYNKATSVYYTLANDSSNLYLVIQSKEKTITNKILRGGVSFVVNPSAKKKSKEGFTVTFPVTAPTNIQSMMQSMTGGAGTAAFRQMDPEQMMKRGDSVMEVANKKQIAALKEIKVLGFKDISDSIISVYNSYGIKASALFDAQGALTYELSMPLQLLGISANNQAEFAYNVKLNGMQLTGFPGGGNAAYGGGGNFGGGGPPPGGFGGGASPAVSSRMADMLGMISPTDFWGKYTLAKSGTLK